MRFSTFHSPKKRTIFLAAALVASSPAAAQSQRDEADRAAVRQMFPIVKLFDKKRPTAPTPAPADTPQGGARLKEMNVGGVTLGLTPTQARAAALKGGYTLKASSMGPNWEGMVQDIESRDFDRPYGPRPQDVLLDTFTGPGRQELMVWYAQERTGPRSATVYFTIPAKDTSWEAMIDAADTKYGAPSYRSVSKLAFCSAGEKACDAYGLYRLQHVELTFDIISIGIKLAQGQDYTGEVNQSIRDEVNRRHPKTAKPTF